VPQVDIAMPTYNSAAWIDECIESVAAQDFANWRLVARDDGSKDDTAARLAAWQKRLGPRMTILEDSGTRNLGVTGNYTAVLARTNTRWVMLADPDDVWLGGKITRTLAAMRESEAELGGRTPLLVCTDATVVDGERRLVAPSFWRWSRMNPAYVRQLSRVAMESVALGSTVMVNRALLERALPIAPGAPYQDWWMALVAAAFGRLRPLPETTILYRRHGVNETADPYGSTLGGAVRRMLSSPAAPRRRVQKLLRQASRQAASFVARYRAQLERRDLAALESLAELASLSLLGRRAAVLRHGLWFASPVKNAGLLALI
jgi:glycosyltransferase involved in cell wall biosynthesis